MKISLAWLSDFLPVTAGPLEAQAVADALTAGGFPVESIQRQPDDTVLDVEVTSNRGDCLCHLGIARELSALLNRPFQAVHPHAPESPDAGAAASLVSVRVDQPDLCPLYTARLLRGVAIAPSPPWLARRLESVGLRPINNVVDVTNYVMFEMGQPLHAFDFDKLHGGQIIVRTAKPRDSNPSASATVGGAAGGGDAGETILSIDGHERRLTNRMLVIADADRPVAVAGVMGGRDTEVCPTTTNVLLESAQFDPLSVRRTSRALTLKSDSSYRFERGIDPALPPLASLRAAQLILQTAGGQLLTGLVATVATNPVGRKLKLRWTRLAAVLGIDLPRQTVLGALDRLRLSPQPHEDGVEVRIPTYRQDLTIEADLVEEVARVIGYDAIPVRQEIAIRLTPPDPQARSMEKIRATLTAAGYFEAVTFSFVSDLLAADFLPAGARLPRADSSVRKSDAQLRPSLLPGLLEAVRRNETVGTPSAKLWEIGSTFLYDPAGKLQERRKVALVGSDDLPEVRGAVESLLARLNPDRPLTVIPEDRPGYAPSACGRLDWAGEPIGHLGRIDRVVADKLSLRALPAAAELDLSALLAHAQLVPQLHPLPRFPTVRRDLTLIVAEATPYQRLENLVRELRLDFLEDLEFVTTYRGKPLDAGQKSFTITLIFRSPTDTLTSDQVESSVQRLIAAAKDQLAATLRT